LLVPLSTALLVGMPPSTSSYDAFPPFFYYFFCYVEPFLTYAGSFSAVWDPAKYYHDLVPLTLAPEVDPQDVHTAGKMAIRQLGSCFFLFATIAFFFIRPMSGLLRNQPSLLYSLIASYLFSLAAADLTHIFFTMYDLGYEGTVDVSNWNLLVWGNIGITTGLFVTRMSWFLVVGREKANRERAQAKTK